MTAETEQYEKGPAPHSLAALRPFPPGVSGNPGGSRPGGAYVAEWLNQFLAESPDGEPRYARADLKAISNDPSASPAKAAAAGRVLRAMTRGERFVIGKDGETKPAALDPVPQRELDSILDRDLGRATERIITQQRTLSILEIRATLHGFFADPTMHAELSEEPELAVTLLRGLLSQPSIRATVEAAGLVPRSEAARPASLFPSG